LIDLFFQLIKFLYHLCGNNFGLAIVLLGVLTRVAFFPLSRQQSRTTKKMNDLAPALKKLKEKYKNDKKRFQEEQLKLYQQHGINPAAGCLPVIVQIVVFSLLYQAFYKFLEDKTFNMNFLYWHLNKPDVFMFVYEKGKTVALPGLLVFLSSATQFIYSKMMMPRPVPVEKNDKPKEVEEKLSFMEEMGKSQSQMIYIFPVMFLFFGMSWPSGLALYWTVSTLCAIIEYKINTRQMGENVPAKS
jgi:YidC/Oxa1 family membrane protein insertase